MELNLKRDINKTIEMIEKSKAKEKITDRKYDKVYAFATINYKDLYQEMSGSFKSFLGITGSTSPLLNAVTLGCKSATCFDISLPAFCFAYFQIASALALDYNEYIHFMFDHAGHKSFNFETYQKIRDYLSSDVKKYFDVIYDYVGEEDFRRHFFVCMDNPKNSKVSFSAFLKSMQLRNNFLTEAQFNQLKNNLKTLHFQNLWMDMREIPEFLNGNLYDVIVLSCANHFIYDQSNRSSKTVEEYIELIAKFRRLLTMDGRMQAALIYVLKDKSITMYEEYERFEYMLAGYEEVICDKENMYDASYIYKKR